MKPALPVDQLRRHHQLAQRAGRGPALTAGRRLGFDAWAELVLATPEDPAWRLEQRGYEPALEHEQESRLAISNGALGVRGSLEQPTLGSRPRLLVAGLFDQSDREPRLPGLVWLTDWLRLSLSLNGEPLTLASHETRLYRRVLDFRRGLLLGEWLWQSASGLTAHVRTLRCACLADRALWVQLGQITYDRPVHAELEGWVEPAGESLTVVRAGLARALLQTRHSAQFLAVAGHLAIHRGADRLRPSATRARSARWEASVGAAQPTTYSRVVALARADDEREAEQRAAEALHRAEASGLPRLLARHERTWSDRWAASDVVVEGDPEAQRALRFALYHLISAANPDDDRVSIGARALTGEAYLGHVFWDTEIFMLPFYTFTWPAAARALLMYRYHTLPAARAKAAGLGFNGALYAWESAGDGAEATPPYAIGPDGQVIRIRCGTDEQHISADVAYAVWQYWQATADSSFLLEAGAEIMLETARFWASRAALESDGRYHIRGVIGPDEYHEGVDDNAYTNVLAEWNLERGLEVAQVLQRRWPARWAVLREQLALTLVEQEHWQTVAEGLAVGRDADTGVFEQFAGFFGLESIDLAAYTPRTAPMDVLLGRERTQQSQVIKQADVVMLLALLPERFSAEQREANFRYYEPRCGHGSSLSPAVHALVAARLGDLRLAETYFHQAASIDLDDSMGNAALGIHIAALGGLWQAVVFGFAGLGLCRDGLRLDPHLPERWQALRFSVQWQGRQIEVEIQQTGTLTATLRRGKPLKLYIPGRVHRLRGRKAWTFRLDEDGPGRMEAEG